MSVKNQENLAFILLNPISFTSRRLPNFNEAITSAAIQSFVDLFTQRIKLSFINNLPLSVVFKDFLRLPAIVANVLNQNSLGYTDVYYDEGAIYSNLVKLGCKAAILPPASLFVPAKSFNYMVISSSYICEVPSSFLNIATKEKQKHDKAFPQDKKIGYWEYIFAQYKKIWMKEALVQAVVKLIIADQLRLVGRNIGYEDEIRIAATEIDNKISGANFLPRSDIYSKFSVITDKILSNIKAFSVFSSVLLVDLGASFVSEIIDACFLGTLTRTMQAFLGVLTREFNEANKAYAYNVISAVTINSFFVDLDLVGAADL